MKKFTIASIIIVVIVATMVLLDKGSSVSTVDMTSTTTSTEATTTRPAEGTVVMESAQLAGIARSQGVTVRPLSILEDSRCPTDARCIQAGTVRLEVEIGGAVATTTKELRLNDAPVLADGWRVALVRATPDPISTESIGLTDYTFYFTITKTGASTEAF